MYLRLSPYQEVLQGILTDLQVNEGIIKLTGKSGAGKTALCSQLFHELQSTGQPVVFFLKPPANASVLQNDILAKLNLDTSGNFTRLLTAHLAARTTDQRPLVLIFDDAQQLDHQSFSAIRMLCNIQDRSRALIRVILCGSEELDARLAGPALRAVTQFLSQSITLPYLSQEQMRDFCQGYWLAAADEMKPLSEKAWQKLFHETGGNPGILQARLKQGTTGAEKSDRQKESEGALPVIPVKYAGRRQGWLPTVLIVGGLVVLGGAAAYFLLGLTSATDTDATGTMTEPLVREAPVVVAATTEPPPVIQAPEATAPAEEAEVAEPEPAAASVATVAEPATDTAAVAIAEPAGAAPAAAEIVNDAASEAVPANAAAVPALPPVEAFIAEWAASWQSRDVDGYLAHYHPDFVPALGVAPEAWREQRRRVISAAEGITIGVEPLESNVEAQDGKRLVRFWLAYSTATYADRTLKELLLAPVDGDWQILVENNIRTESE